MTDAVKRGWIEAHHKLTEAAGDLELSPSVRQLIDENQRKITDFELIIPLIGEFSSGKSSLLNAVLNTDMLPTDITPETAIATEIRCGSTPRIEACDAAGGATSFTLDAIDEIDPGRYDHLRIYTDSDFCQRHPGVVLVDMPGLNANIQAHNKAIHRYLPRAKAALVLSVLKEGTLRQTLIDHLEEFDYFGSRLAVLLTKADEIPLSEAENIEARVRTSLPDIYVGTVSAHEGNLAAFDEALSHFSYPDLLAETATMAIQETADLLTKTATRRMRLIFANHEEIDRLIDELEQKRHQYARSLEQQRHNLDRRFGMEMKERILDRVGNALEANASTLARHARVDQQAFATEVSRIVKRELTLSFEEEVVPELDQAFAALEAELSQGIETGESLFSNLLNQTETVAQGLHRIGERLDKNARLKSLGQLMMGLAFILTNYINPVLEAILMLVPQLAGLFGQSPEDRIRTQVIPEIRQRLEPEIQAQLRHIVTRYLKELDEAFQQNTRQIEEALQQQRQQRQQRIEEAEAEKDSLQSFIDHIQRLAHDLTRQALPSPEPT